MPVGALLGHARSEACRNGIQRVFEVSPFGRRINASAGTKGAGFAWPDVHGALRFHNFFCGHACEPIIAGIKLPDMFKAEILIVARPVGRAGLTMGVGRAKLTRFCAAGMGALLPRATNTAVKPVG